ncbi:Alpha/Beta hydrolase protein [Mycena albidolilacea]|uniref:Dipeptidyl-peptidase V n=1 Tax=Mycena albidolilacea TaxID=1033008 RepID=A0AAD7A0C6_9AGAR|nr:Alpha/Beta hydrolase protein [Mycena albidolilacea]
MPDGTIPTENGTIHHASGLIEDDESQDLATRISASGKVREIRISPDGAHVVYQNQHQYKVGASTETELWVAETDVPGSARLLTGGGFFNGGTVFHPDGKRIVFLSDRASPGKAGTMYSLDFATADANTAPEVIDTGGKTVQGFDLSPDGAWIVFLSPAETGEAHAARVKEKDDAKVYGEKLGLSRILLYNFATGETSELKGVRDDLQVESATWSPDSSEILYRMRQNKGVEYSEMPIVVERIAIAGENAVPIPVATYPRSPSGQSLWLGSGHIADLQSYVPSNTLDARTLFVNPVGKPFSDRGEGATTRLYGVSEDAVRIVNMQPGLSTADGESFIAVEVCNDIDTHMDVVVCSTDGSPRTSVQMFETDDDAVWFSAWDARRVVDTSGEVSYIFASILSSAIRHEPLNAYSIRVDSKGALKKRVKLSSHLQWLANAPRLRTENIYWKAADGTQLSGLVRYPPGYESGKLPTVLFLHGGPYRRMIPDYMPYFCNWRELLAWSGYLVISPNYRGSQGRGHEFAHAATLGVGVLDWADCDSMVDEMVRRGVADPEHLGVGGWSHGASIAAWGITKSKTRYKAAIIGAGVTNWEGMVMESGSPELEVAIGGSTPWDHDAPEKSERKTSPVHSVAGVSTAVLILHGERDERVPVGQAIGFWRGLKRRAVDRGKEAAELVIYPREPHGFVERKHAEDVQRRVVAYFKAWL